MSMNFIALLQAAEFLERREREAEHGYASSKPVQVEISRQQSKSLRKVSQENRATHNELEGNRRALLRNYIEKLSELVPLGPESSRHTTLGLLIKANTFIKTLDDMEKKYKEQKEILMEQRKKLRCRLNELLGQYNVITVHKVQKISECNVGTSVDTNSCVPETDNLNIIGSRVVKNPGFV